MNHRIGNGTRPSRFREACEQLLLRSRELHANLHVDRATVARELLDGITQRLAPFPKRRKGARYASHLGTEWRRTLLFEEPLTEIIERYEPPPRPELPPPGKNLLVDYRSME